MSSASDDGSEYNPDRNHQHEEGEGSPEQPQSSRAVGKGKTSKISQQATKQSKGQNEQQSNLSNIPPLPPNYAPYPSQPLGTSTQTDDEQAKADRQQLYALLRQQVGQGLPQGVSSMWALTAGHLLANRVTTFGIQGPNANYDIGPQQGASSGPSFGL
jgi:hypothetical protein